MAKQSRLFVTRLARFFHPEELLIGSSGVLCLR